MNKTCTPLIIEGKIYVVVDAPEMPVPYHKSIHDEILKACTKYETLPEHAPYWKEKIGQRVEVELRVGLSVTGGLTAIPPQQKHGDDLWDEAEKGCKALPPDQPYGAYSYTTILNYLKSNYSLKRKL